MGYGYLDVGTVEQGPPELRGRTVFCLYPNQTAYVVPAGAVTVVRDDLTPARAVLAGTVEPRRTTADRLALARPSARPRLDVVVTGESRFDEMPGVMARLAAAACRRSATPSL